MMLGEPPQGNVADRGEDDRGRTAGVDPDDPRGIGGGQLDKALLDGVVEGVSGGFETIERELLGTLAVLRGRAGKLEQEGEVRPDVHAGLSVQPLQRGNGKTAPSALICERRVRVAIGDDHGPGLKRREDALAEELDPPRDEEQGLGPGVDPDLVMLEQVAPDQVAELGVTGPQGDDIATGAAQLAGKRSPLGALARSVDPLQRDEETGPGRHGHGV